MLAGFENSSNTMFSKSKILSIEGFIKIALFFFASLAMDFLPVVLNLFVFLDFFFDV